MQVQQYNAVFVLGTRFTACVGTTLDANDPHARARTERSDVPSILHENASVTRNNCRLARAIHDYARRIVCIADVEHSDRVDRAVEAIGFWEKKAYSGALSRRCGKRHHRPTCLSGKRVLFASVFGLRGHRRLYEWTVRNSSVLARYNLRSTRAPRRRPLSLVRDRVGDTGTTRETPRG